MFDAKRFLTTHFRDADGVIGLLSAYSQPRPPKDTARKWFERNTIPGEWLPVILAVLELENARPVSIAPFLLSGQKQ